MVLVKIYVNKGKYIVKIIQVEIYKLSHFSKKIQEWKVFKIMWIKCCIDTREFEVDFFSLSILSKYLR